jgi:hypothetical protein
LIARSPAPRAYTWNAALPPASRYGPAPWLDPGALALVLLAATLFPRVLTAAGAPSALNFAHFAIAAPLVLLALPEMRSAIGRRLLVKLGALLFAIAASALHGGAGELNAVLDFVLLSEPFLFLLLVTSRPMSALQLRRFRLAVLAFSALHVLLGVVQGAVLHRIHDDVKGVFLGQGAGHHVGGAVSLIAAAYLCIGRDSREPRALRVLAVALCWWESVLSDSKQVVVAFVAAGIGLAFLQTREVQRAAAQVLLALCALAGLWLVRDLVPILPQVMESWRMIGGIEQKFSIGPFLVSHYEGFGSWIVGLGPGHTVGRLASSLLDYRRLLEPLGATLSPITAQAIILRESSEFSSTTSITSSSVWSPLFFWAGLWGDLGLAGLLAYLSLGWTVWRDICLTSLARFLVLSVIVLGILFAWLEEPAYMLFVAAVLGIEWQSVQPRPELARARGVS